MISFPPHRIVSSHLGTHNKAIADTFPDERLVLLEDTAELVVEVADLLQLQITPKIGMRELVKFSLRVTPNRIIVGEVRGGCATVHGEDVDKALERLSLNLPPRIFKFEDLSGYSPLIS